MPQDLVVDLHLVKAHARNINVVHRHERLPNDKTVHLLEQPRVDAPDLCQLEQRHEIQDIKPETLLHHLLVLLVRAVKDVFIFPELAGLFLDLVKLLLDRLQNNVVHRLVVVESQLLLASFVQFDD